MPIIKFLPVFLLAHLFIAASSSVQIVNKQCPYSNKAIDTSQILSYGVCCSNCAKKASSNIKDFIKKTKPNNKTCPFSAKPIRKKISIGFCCSKCKKKASL
jgi:bacterioferritin-associated ferredoxin